MENAWPLVADQSAAPRELRPAAGAPAVRLASIRSASITDYRRVRRSPYGGGGLPFTLIELLVVVAIIAIPAAMLLPVLGRARDTARRSMDVSNMKSLHLALSLYLDENDERNPAGAAAHPGSKYAWGHEYTYFVQLAPYAGFNQVTAHPKSPDASGQFAAYAALIPNNGPIARSVFRCPASTFSTTDDYASAKDPWGNGGVMPWWEYCSYGIYTSGWSGKYWKTDGTTHWWNLPIYPFDASGTVVDKQAADFVLGRVLSSAAKPERTAVFGHYCRPCVWWELESAVGWAAPSYDFGQIASYYPGASPNSHYGSLPSCFLDGHVDILPLSQLLVADEYGPAGRAPLWRMTFW